jgi:hypothetical protein
MRASYTRLHPTCTKQHGKGCRAVGAVLRSLFLLPSTPHPRVASRRSQALQISPDCLGHKFLLMATPSSVSTVSTAGCHGTVLFRAAALLVGSDVGGYLASAKAERARRRDMTTQILEEITVMLCVLRRQHVWSRVSVCGQVLDSAAHLL